MAANSRSQKFTLCLVSLLSLGLSTIANAQPVRVRAGSDFKAAAEATYNVNDYGRSDIGKLTRLLNRNPALVRQRNEKGETLLHLAARGNSDIIKLLLARKSDINALDGRKLTPLYHAISGNCIECARALLTNKAEPNLRSSNGNLLHAAAGYVTAEPLKFVLTYKLDVNARNDAGLTPLMEAARRGYRHDDESVELLIANQADVTLKNKKGQTALHLAAERWSAGAIQMLLARDMDVNARDSDGNTPLLLLAAGSSSGSTYTLEEAVKALLDGKADVNAQNNLGETALFIACKRELSELVQILLANKANADLKTRDGQSPSCRHDAKQ